MESATGPSQGRSEQSTQLLFPLTSLLGKIEDKFVEQVGRIVFHKNDAENDYKLQERRLSTLMLEKSLSDEKHIQYAGEIITLADSYKQGFIRSLQKLNDEIELELLEFQQTLSTVPKHTEDMLKTTTDMERWLCLSMELKEVRQMATNCIVEQTEADKFIPMVIIKNNGRADISFSEEESKQVKVWEANAALMKKSYENNQRIQREREPLTKRLLPVEDEAEGVPVQIPLKPQPMAKSIHPLEGKAWFRSLKVVYVAFWIAGLGLSAMIAYGDNDFPTFLVGAIIVVIVLIAVKKVFYYVILGRTTANEKPGKGFVDLEELQNDLMPVQVNSPDVYRKVVAPFFDSWKVQYGRRVPFHAVNLLQQRITHEMSAVKEKKQKIIDKAAGKGTTIEISSLRENLEHAKAEFKGPDRQQYIRQLDLFVMSLEAKYGTAIPIDEASKLCDKLEEDIRAAGE